MSVDCDAVRGDVEISQEQTMSDTTRAELERVVRDASVPNWDGYGGLPVNAQTHKQARRFLARIPNTFPRPSIGVDPDGEVAFDWYTFFDTFSVSVRGDGRLSWASTWTGMHGECYLTRATEDGGSGIIQ